MIDQLLLSVSAYLYIPRTCHIFIYHPCPGKSFVKTSTKTTQLLVDCSVNENLITVHMYMYYTYILSLSEITLIILVLNYPFVFLSSRHWGLAYYQNLMFFYVPVHVCSYYWRPEVLCSSACDAYIHYIHICTHI